MKRILFLLALVLLLSGCKDKKNFTVTGVVRDTKEKNIYISRLDIDTPVLIDSAKLSRKGSFRLKIKTKGAEFYQLGFASTNFITLLAEPGENINLLFNGKNLYDNYTVSGSLGTQKLQMLDLVLAETRRRLDSLSNLYTKESAEPGFDVKKPLLEAEYAKLLKAQRKMNIEFIINNLNSLASIKALYQRIYPETYVLNDQHDLQYLKIVTDSLTRHYPNSGQVQALARDFEKEMKQMYVSRISEIAKNLPETKLDPDLKTIEGKKIALSSLKGKYVLLTFWSYQSKDCIAENLELKEYYKLYNKKGFEIYQINLDENESNWKAAVKFDELPWINTREDDPKHAKYAMMFNVQSVPANYLFNKETKIIASNLHGRELRLKLEQLFNN
jgi:thiol-disulfide isomerase/thioredoxin